MPRPCLIDFVGQGVFCTSPTVSRTRRTQLSMLFFLPENCQVMFPEALIQKCLLYANRRNLKEITHHEIHSEKKKCLSSSCLTSFLPQASRNSGDNRTLRTWSGSMFWNNLLLTFLVDVEPEVVGKLSPFEYRNPYIFCCFPKSFPIKYKFFVFNSSFIFQNLFISKVSKYSKPIKVKVL